VIEPMIVSGALYDPVDVIAGRDTGGSHAAMQGDEALKN
jgi:hypothetical protein